MCMLHFKTTCRPLEAQKPLAALKRPSKLKTPWSSKAPWRSSKALQAGMTLSTHHMNYLVHMQLQSSIQVVDNNQLNELKMQDVSSLELLKQFEKHIIETATLIEQVEIKIKPGWFTKSELVTSESTSATETNIFLIKSEPNNVRTELKHQRSLLQRSKRWAKWKWLSFHWEIQKGEP